MESFVTLIIFEKYIFFLIILKDILLNKKKIHTFLNV
jgi:hypothetical protein